ncbi:hypothetical protein Ddc_09502 [Ditylenchus destructor]|nr:hypothetical protein Ddc_09502 [Ditylenchus destructor]
MMMVVDPFLSHGQFISLTNKTPSSAPPFIQLPTYPTSKTNHPNNNPLETTATTCRIRSLFSPENERRHQNFQNYLQSRGAFPFSLQIKSTHPYTGAGGDSAVVVMTLECPLFSVKIPNSQSRFMMGERAGEKHIYAVEWFGAESQAVGGGNLQA